VRKAQARIKQHLSSSRQPKALVLLRQLTFVKTTMFHGGGPYCGGDPDRHAVTAPHIEEEGSLRARTGEMVAFHAKKTICGNQISGNATSILHIIKLHYKFVIIILYSFGNKKSYSLALRA
jgi:hypothetical protein